MTNNFSHYSDNELMHQVKNGAVEPLGELYERYKNVLYKFYFNMMHNAALSEDLVQNVFIRILKYKEKFRGDGEFKYWLFSIARNVRFDHFRKKGNAPKDDIEHWSAKLAEDENIHRTLIQKEEISLLRKAIKMMDEDKREVLVLSRLNGLKYREIADILEITEGAVKVRVFRGLRELKNIYFELEKHH